MKLTLEIDARTALRWILGALLIWAALAKIANPTEFHGDLLAYRFPFPSALLRLAAVVVPWLELLCGILMIAGRARRAAVWWAVVLFAVFVLATGQAWARGLEISCGCFKLDFLGTGALVKLFESVQFAFFRALFLLLCAAYLLREPTQPAPAGQPE